MKKIAILTKQIGHYHNARYVGASSFFDEVNVISTMNEGGFSELLAKDLGGYEIHRVFRGEDAYKAALNGGSFVPAVEGLLTEIGPKAVAVAGWASPESYAALSWALKTGAPVVMMSESQSDDASRFWVREYIKKRIVALTDAALVGGRPHSTYMTDLGMSAEKIFLGYNAVDNEHFEKGAALARKDDAFFRSKYSLPKRYLLASARFIKKKNLPALVSAYAHCALQLGHDVPDLVILGDGMERNEILSIASSNDIAEKVHLPGFKSYDELPYYYGLADAFIHVSTREQWGLVVNEAMAAGLPVVVSERCGVARSVITNGKNGYVVATDTKAIASALVDVLSLSPTQRAKMGNAASAEISNWGPSRFGQGLLGAYDAAQKYANERKVNVIDNLILSFLRRRLIEKID